MNDDLETLLQEDFLRPPPHFSQRVMQRIQPLRRHTPLADGTAFAPERPRPGLLSRLRWLAAGAGLVGGGLLGLSQLGSFVFGLWIASSAS